MAIPAIPTLFVHDWSVSWPLTADLVLMALLYVAAARRADDWPLARTVAFIGGLVAVALALQSGVNTFDDSRLSVHMVQHVLILLVAPALLIGARPIHLALRVLPRNERHALGRMLVIIRRGVSPWWCLALFSVITLLSHLPGLFDLTVRHQGPHDLEHGLYLLAGLALWWPLLGDLSASRRPGTVAQLAYVIIAMVPMTLIGAYLSRDPTVFYSAYANPGRGPTDRVVADQQQAGAIMWVAGTLVMAGFGLLAVTQSMIAAERRQARRDLRGSTS